MHRKQSQTGFDNPIFGWFVRHDIYVYWLLAAALLVPIWLPSIFVTLDGPAHLAVVSHWMRIGDPEFPQLQKFLFVDLAPVPNLTCYFLLRIFMLLVDPIIAEKLLASFYVLLFAFAGRYFTRTMGSNTRGYSYLFLLLIFNFSVEFGLYNFIIGVPLFLIGTAFWISHRENISIVTFVGFAAISFACYFTHLISLAMLIISIGLIEIQAYFSDWRRSGGSFVRYFQSSSSKWAKRWLPIIAAHIPVVVLSLMFIFRGSDQFSSAAVNFSERPHLTVLLKLGKIGSGASFATLDQFTLMFSAAIVIIGLLSLALTLRHMGRRQGPMNPITLCLFGILALYLFLPDYFVTHWMSSRLMVYLFVIFVIWLCAFGVNLSLAAAGKSLVSIAVMVAIYFTWNLPVRAGQYLRHADYIQEILSAAPTLKKDKTIFTIRVRAKLKNNAIFRKFDMILQAQSYFEIEPGMIGLKNIQLNSGITPVHYRRSVNPYVHLANDPQTIRYVPVVDLPSYHKNTGKHVDYVLLWGRKQYFKADGVGHELKLNLERSHRLVFQSPRRGLVRIYRRKTD